MVLPVLEVRVTSADTVIIPVGAGIQYKAGPDHDGHKRIYKVTSQVSFIAYCTSSVFVLNVICCYLGCAISRYSCMF